MDLQLPPGLAELADARAPPRLNAEQTLVLLRAALAHARLPQAAAALATEMARVLDCERVFVGAVERRFARVVGLSHTSQASAVAGEAPLLIAVARAMDEALDQGACVVYPQHPDERPRITLAHADLAHQHRCRSLLTVPLFVAGEPVGALVLERARQAHFDAAWSHVAQTLATELAPWLRLQSEHERPAWRRARHRLSLSWRALPTARRWACAAGLVMFAVALAALLMTSFNHDIAAATRLEGRVQRAVVAPLDGFLKSVHVRAGDTVTAGQLLAELADEDLLLEQRRRQTEVAQHESAYGDAMARQDRAALVLAEARAAEAKAQLGLVEQQLARMRLLAPYDAQVIAGDLSQQLAAPLRRGELLFTLTPTRELRVMLQLDEADAAHVKAGARGRVTLSALPEQRFDLVVERVMPVAQVLDGRNVFEAEARLQGTAVSELRPGMQGLAQIHAGQQPLLWLASHRAVDWLRLQWWRWIG